MSAICLVVAQTRRRDGTWLPGPRRLGLDGAFGAVQAAYGLERARRGSPWPAPENGQGGRCPALRAAGCCPALLPSTLLLTPPPLRKPLLSHPLLLSDPLR